MKVSVLTATYNRCEELEKLYTSLVVNAQSGVDFEWLIMDDGSTDKTKVNVQNYIKQNIFHIEYYHQKNQGKMAAINNLMEHVNGDICFTCDSDDQLTVNCMDIIKKHSKKLLNDETVYALLFLRKLVERSFQKMSIEVICFLYILEKILLERKYLFLKLLLEKNISMN